ncbi:MAG: 50S ribosomal protein L23 [Candidatus Omnitrophica bacterium]|nr:50S ribosomal protein L23 [Candidatus Omnitrophota bacterium]
MRQAHEVVEHLLQTEKGTRMAAERQYCFKVSTRANKHEVKRAVESLFKVDVLCVRTVMVPGKWRRVRRALGRRPDWKKAIVTVKDGQKIELT